MTRVTPAEPARADRPSRVSTVSGGWAGSAGLLLIAVGSLQAVEAVAAIVYDDHYVGTANGLVVRTTYSGWAWLLVALAGVSVVAGHSVIRARARAQFWAIGAAVAGIVTNLGLTGVVPIWTAILITLDIVVIWALCVPRDE